MYGRGSGNLIAPAATTIAAVVLPNTGMFNSVVNIALSIGVGLITWGVAYTQFNR